ncbi:MAG TPA: hypothetical protein VFL15_06115 [Gammaproteobacteria bacterium]|nr:hypothetical protein [Gammaproteobacteria bacterium]
MTRFGSSVLITVALWALFVLAACSAFLPAQKQFAQPTTAVAHTPLANPPQAAIAVYATQANGMPADNVLVYAQPLDAHAVRVDDPPAVLNILDRHFQPALLPVHEGGTVTVQNLDGVAHDVYSFSQVRPLSLHLAPGERETGLRFPHAGVVAVGCKIYNEMQGYIYVTDAPYFGTTDLNGYLRLGDLPTGRYRIGVWSHAIPAKGFPGFPLVVTLKAGPDEVVRIRIRKSRAVGTL